jgi:transcriptional regulator with XRE-family HTH domain
MLKIKAMRKEQGVTQEQLAKKSHVDRANLSRLESGKVNATTNTLSKIAAALDCEVKDLL